MSERLNYKPIPFIGPPNSRATGTRDERYVNIVYEKIVNEALKEQQIYCIKRPGFSLTSVSTDRSEGRGLFTWPSVNQYVQVFDNTLSTWNAQASMNTSSGRCWNVLIPESSGNEIMIVSDGQDNYNITSTGAITQIDQSDSPDYPVSNLGPIVYLDGRIFQGQANGRIQQSNLNSVSSWTASTYITADTHAGKLEAIHIQKDQIMGFTRNRTEFFFNNGNPSGSVLLRIDQNTIGVGMAASRSLAWSGETACWVGENESDGDAGRAIYSVQSLSRVRSISGPLLNRLLQAEKESISSCNAWMERVDGRLLYGLRLPFANRTFIYGFDTEQWSEWSDISNNALLVSFVASLRQQIYTQNAAGHIHTLSHSTYQDAGQNFTVRLQTRKLNYGTNEFKTQPGLTLIADQTTGGLSTYISDDDYQTTTYLGTIDMTQPWKKIGRLGGFHQRSYTFEYADNSSFRAQAFIPEINR